MIKSGNGQMFNEYIHIISYLMFSQVKLSVLIYIFKLETRERNEESTADVLDDQDATMEILKQKKTEEVEYDQDLSGSWSTFLSII